MATSDVEIANIAFGLLSVATITSLTEQGKAAILVNSIYTSIRDATLRAIPWNFAQVRASLSRHTTAPAFGFAYQFIVPVSPYCLRINEIDPEDTVFTIETDAAAQLRLLLTDEPAVKVRYTARITDPALFDAEFVQAFGTHLAAEMAYPLTESREVAKDMRAKYEALVNRAATTDAQEGSTQVADINVLLEARLQGRFEDFNRSKNKFA
jgi:hypothetical protein